MEQVAGQRLPLGGINGYVGVRRQGRDKNKFQGATPQKFDRTKLFDTPRDAAIALAQLKEDIALGIVESKVPKKTGLPELTADAAQLCSAPQLAPRQVTTQLPIRPPAMVCVNRMPLVAAALLTADQAAALLARGVRCVFALSRDRQQVSGSETQSLCIWRGCGVRLASLGLAIYICQDYRVQSQDNGPPVRICPTGYLWLSGGCPMPQISQIWTI